MVKSVRCLNGKMCPESFPAYLLDFEICFFVYLLDTYIFIVCTWLFLLFGPKNGKKCPIYKIYKGNTNKPKKCTMYTGNIWTSLVYSKYMLPPHEMDIFRYLDQNYGKKCPFCISEALFQF